MERPQRNQGKGGAGKAFKGNAFCYGNKKTNVTVQDGGKMGAKAGVKLAYKSVFPPIFTWDFLNSYNNCILKVPRPVGPGAFFVVGLFIKV